MWAHYLYLAFIYSGRSRETQYLVCRDPPPRGTTPSLRALGACTQCERRAGPGGPSTCRISCLCPPCWGPRGPPVKGCKASQTHSLQPVGRCQNPGWPEGPPPRRAGLLCTASPGPLAPAALPSLGTWHGSAAPSVGCFARRLAVPSWGRTRGMRVPRPPLMLGPASGGRWGLPLLPRPLPTTLCSASRLGLWGHAPW